MARRVNNAGYVEIQDPDTGGWMPAVTMYPVQGGHRVTLADAQNTLLNQIRASLYGDLNDNALVRLAAIAAALDDGTSTDIKSMVEAIASTLAVQSGQLNLTNGYIDTVETLLGQIRSQIGVWSGSDTNTILGAINTALSGWDGQTTNTTLAAINTALSGWNGTTSNNSLASILSSFDFQALAQLNSGNAIINAVSAATSSSAIAVSSQALSLNFQCYFSNNTASATFIVETRRVAGSSALANRRLSQVLVTATTFDAGTNNFAGDDFVTVPSQGCVECLVHLRAISAGNVSIFGYEVR